MNEFNYEKLGEISLCVSEEHRFGTDAFLLGNFANPKRNDKVCDLCSGMGIVAFFMKNKFNPQKIYTVEIQEKAVLQQEMTIEKSNIEGIIPILADLKTEWESFPKDVLEVVTCNPPYKIAGTGAKNDLDAVAIARHEILCNIDDVCKTASKMLKFGGRLCLCNRPERLCDVILAMKEYNIEPKRIRFVSKNSESAPWLFLIEGRKGGKPFLQVEKPLYVQGENGFSDELLSIYG